MFSSSNYSYHVMMKIRHIILRPVACLTLTFLVNAIVDGIFAIYRNKRLRGVCPQKSLTRILRLQLVYLLVYWFPYLWWVTHFSIKGTVNSTSRYIHLQFGISATALQIRAVQSPKCIVWCAVDCAHVNTRGWPPTRWTDDLVKVAGSRWMRAAQDRS
jgi:hypothetical protein